MSSMGFDLFLSLCLQYLQLEVLEETSVANSLCLRVHELLSKAFLSQGLADYF